MQSILEEMDVNKQNDLYLRINYIREEIMKEMNKRFNIDNFKKVKIKILNQFFKRMKTNKLMRSKIH